MHGTIDAPDVRVLVRRGRLCKDEDAVVKSANPPGRQFEVLLGAFPRTQHDSTVILPLRFLGTGGDPASDRFRASCASEKLPRLALAPPGRGPRGALRLGSQLHEKHLTRAQLTCAPQSHQASRAHSHLRSICCKIARRLSAPALALGRRLSAPALALGIVDSVLGELLQDLAAGAHKSKLTE